mmetsp:Transcript_4781/g.9127  ORF Transcript_4781/g.9127 Transcript_4781/m.9127 type:complete len:1047 (+) Transcript_4781:1869-5009(+)
MSQGQDLLYSDDEESHPSDYNESTILLSNLNGGYQTANVPYHETSQHQSEYGSMNSPTSSLGDSDYERRGNQYINYPPMLGDLANNVAMKGGDQRLASILLTVIVICSFSVAFLVSSAQGTGHGANVPGVNDSIQSRMHYFPFPDGTVFSPEGGLVSSVETSKYVPFKSVDRKELSVDASQIVFPDLFHSSLRLPKNSSKVDINGTSSPLPLLKVPFPTGAFWTNLVIAPTSDREFSYPVMSYPYAYKWNPSMMQVSYPPLRRLTDKISIRDIFNPDMTFGTEEDIIKRNIVRFDPLSVTLRFYSHQVNPHIEENGSDPDPKSSYWESYLVQGSPYITAKFNDVTPIFTPLSIFNDFGCAWDDVDNKNTSHAEMFGVCSKLESTDGQSVILNGVQFLVRAQENLSWMIFASEPITLALDSSRRNIRSEEKFTGVIRFVLIPPPLHDNALKQNGNQYEGISLNTSQGVKRLIYHAHTYPVGAKVSWDFQDIAATSTSQLLNSNHQDILQGSQDKVRDFTVGTVNFVFQVKSMNSDDCQSTPILDKTLLMLALPHHTAVLPSNMILNEFDLEYQCIKGLMKPIVGSQWSYVEQLTDIGFDQDQDIRNLQNLTFEQEQVILNQVDLDLGRVLPTLTENVYGFGKQIARLAQLCHIASILERPSFQSGATNGTVSRVLTSRATGMLQDFLTKYLDGFSTDNLLYDINFGGIVTHNGILNMQEDFGNGWYNDHHFHYGYILYAAAILGRFNSTFVDTYGIHIDSILYDVAHGANDSSDLNGGAFFPFTRHKSWFDGHSFASGLFPFADGKSQESSSEAVNCYYGAYLWSLVRWSNVDDFQERINFAKLLLAMEIRGAKTYWHMMTQNGIREVDPMGSVTLYNQDFEEGLMVGNLGMMDVTVATWFGTQQLYVHMINFMPVTAITKELFSKPYIEKEFDEVIKPIFDGVEMAWRGYTISDKALIYPTEAWQDAEKLRSYELDSALSQSQVYFWIASMNGFNASIISTGATANHVSTQSSDDASCDNHQGCVLQNLEGLCCPSSEGVMLECCQ